MPEWWTYGLSDFLMFSPRAYQRLVERYNEALWPGQLGALAAGLAAVGVLRWPVPPRIRSRVVGGILAAACAWVAWGFLWRRFATINWPARWFAALFAAEALLVGWLGLTGRLTFEPGRGRAAAIGATLFLAALVLYPLLAPAMGRGWAGAELFGLMPDPTAIGTAGLLLLVDRTSPRRGLLLVPLLWCIIAALTLFALGTPQAWVPLAAFLVILAAHSRT